MTINRSTRVARLCKQCGAEFLTYPAWIKKGGGVFCSRACSDAGRNASVQYKEFPDSFWEKVKKTESCWLWTVSTTNGYGRLWHPVRKVNVLAHRLSWEIAYGELDDNVCVLHDCPGGDNPLCVNPDHLWLGDRAENNLDKVEKGRQQRGEDSGNARLTVEKVIYIRQMIASGIGISPIAKELGVDYGTVKAVARKRTWLHVADGQLPEIGGNPPNVPSN